MPALRSLNGRPPPRAGYGAASTPPRSPRPSILSLRYTLRRWYSTVLGVTNRVWAIPGCSGRRRRARRSGARWGSARRDRSAVHRDAGARRWRRARSAPARAARARRRPRRDRPPAEAARAPLLAGWRGEARSPARRARGSSRSRGGSRLPSSTAVRRDWGSCSRASTSPSTRCALISACGTPIRCAISRFSRASAAACWNSPAARAPCTASARHGTSFEPGSVERPRPAVSASLSASRPRPCASRSSARAASRSTSSRSSGRRARPPRRVRARHHPGRPVRSDTGRGTRWPRGRTGASRTAASRARARDRRSHR